MINILLTENGKRTAKVAELHNWENNPRDITPQDFERLQEQIKLGEYKPILVMSDGTVLGGNMRLKAFNKLGVQDIWVSTIDFEKQPNDKYMAVINGEHNPTKLFDSKEQGMLEYALSDNDRAGYYIDEKLHELLELYPIDQKLYSIDLKPPLTLEQALHTPVTPDEARQTLAERFLVPPFSILDARLGYWQERKKNWVCLGLQSEMGRGSGDVAEGGLTFASSAQSPHIYELKNAFDEQLGRKSKWDEFYAANPEAKESAQSGTSIFDPVLTELSYKWFNVNGGSILDPFAGGSVRGVVASFLGYKYTGIDLSEKQIVANREQAKTIIADKEQPNWIVGDSNEQLDKIEGEFDMIFSCPPYADLEVYSDDPKDLSNMDYNEFKSIYESIITKAVSKLKDNRFAVFVVGEVRDKNGMYYDFVPDTIKAFETAGAKFYNEVVLVTTIGSLAIRVGKQFQSGRKIGKTHQNVLVFYKGDPKEIKNNFPPIIDVDNTINEMSARESI